VAGSGRSLAPAIAARPNPQARPRAGTTSISDERRFTFPPKHRKACAQRFGAARKLVCDCCILLA